VFDVSVSRPVGGSLSFATLISPAHYLLRPAPPHNTAYLSGDRKLVQRLASLQRRLQQRSDKQSGLGSTPPPPPPPPQQQQQQQQLRLCTALLRALQRGAPTGAGATLDTGAWAAALEAPDAAQARLGQLQQQESDLLSQLDALMSDPALAPVVTLPLSDVQPHHHQTHQQQPALDAAPNSNEDTLDPPQDQDRDVPALLTRAATARLLTRSPSPTARRAAYAAGLLPRLRSGSALLGALARCRQEMAALCGARDYPGLCCRQLVAPGGAEVAGFLQEVAEGLRAAADEQVAALLQQQEGEGEEEEGEGTQLGLQPWDWERLNEQACALDAATLESLRPHLTLDAVLLGFSSLLQHLLGVALLPRRVSSSSGSGSSSTELWHPAVRTLAVVHRERGLLGTLYIDTMSGGGYGTRVLRHAPWRWQQQQQQPQPQQQQRRQDGSSSESSEENEFVDSGASGGLWQGELTAAQMWAAAEQLQMPSTQPTSSSGGGDGGGADGLLQLDAHTAAKLQQAAASRPAVTIGLSGPRQRSSGSGGGGAAQQSEQHELELQLSLPLLWELGHEMGHAIHLLLSSASLAATAAATAAQPGTTTTANSGGTTAPSSSAAAAAAASPHLSGRFIPPDLLELPSALFERTLLNPTALTALCRDARSGAPLAPAPAAALAAHFRARYGGALAVQDRVCAALAEQLMGLFPGDTMGEDTWGAVWDAFSSLPPAVEGTTRQVCAARGGVWRAAWCMLCAACFVSRVCLPAHTFPQPHRPSANRNHTATTTAAGSDACCGRSPWHLLFVHHVLGVGAARLQRHRAATAAPAPAAAAAGGAVGTRAAAAVGTRAAAAVGTRAAAAVGTRAAAAAAARGSGCSAARAVHQRQHEQRGAAGPPQLVRQPG